MSELVPVASPSPAEASPLTELQSLSVLGCPTSIIRQWLCHPRGDNSPRLTPTDRHRRKSQGTVRSAPVPCSLPLNTRPACPQAQFPINMVGQEPGSGQL